MEWLFPVRVGCRGFPAQSLWRMPATCGIIWRKRMAVVFKDGEAAERAFWNRNGIGGRS